MCCPCLSSILPSPPPPSVSPTVVAVTLGPLVVAAVLGLIYAYLVLVAADPDLADILNRAASYSMPEELSGAFKQKEETNLRNIFASIDADGGGSVDKEELSRVAMQLNPDSTQEDIEKEVSAMISEASLDGDQEISFPEFLLMLHRARRQGRTNMFASLADQVESKMNRKAGSGVIYSLLLLTFLVLISTSTALLHFFKCQSFDLPEVDGGGAQQYLYKDYSVDCDSNRYKGFVAYAVIMILAYPIGALLRSSTQGTTKSRG